MLSVFTSNISMDIRNIDALNDQGTRHEEDSFIRREEERAVQEMLGWSCQADLKPRRIAEASIREFEGVEEHRRVLIRVSQLMVAGYLRALRDEKVKDKDDIRNSFMLLSRHDFFRQEMIAQGMRPSDLKFPEDFNWDQIARFSRAFLEADDGEGKLSLGGKAVFYQTLIREVSQANESADITKIARNWFKHLLELESIDRKMGLPLVSWRMRIPLHSTGEKQILQSFAERLRQGVLSRQIMPVVEQKTQDGYEVSFLPAYPSTAAILYNLMVSDPELKKIRDSREVMINYSLSSPLKERSHLAFFFLDSMKAILALPQGQIEVIPNLNEIFKGQINALGERQGMVEVIRHYSSDLVIFPMWHSKGAPFNRDIIADELGELAWHAKWNYFSQEFDKWLNDLNDPRLSKLTEELRVLLKNYSKTAKQLRVKLEGNHKSLRNQYGIDLLEEAFDKLGTRYKQRAGIRIGDLISQMMAVFGLGGPARIGTGLESEVISPQERQIWSGRLERLASILDKTARMAQSKVMGESTVSAVLNDYRKAGNLRDLDRTFKRVEATGSELIHGLVFDPPQSKELFKERRGMIDLLDPIGERSIIKLFDVLAQTQKGSREELRAFELLRSFADKEENYDLTDQQMKGSITIRAINEAIRMGNDLNDQSLPLRFLRYYDPTGVRMLKVVFNRINDKAFKKVHDTESLFKLVKMLDSPEHDMVAALVEHALGKTDRFHFVVDPDTLEENAIFELLNFIDPRGERIAKNLKELMMNRQYKNILGGKFSVIDRGAAKAKENLIALIRKEAGEQYKEHGLYKLMQARIINLAQSSVNQSIDIHKKSGIDLSSENMNLQTIIDDTRFIREGSYISRNGRQGIRFRLNPAMLQKIQHSAGFEPRITRIQRLKSLWAFLENNP